MPQVGGPREVGFSYERGTPVGEVGSFLFHITPNFTTKPHLLEYIRAPWQGTGVEGFSDATSKNLAKVLTSLI